MKSFTPPHSHTGSATDRTQPTRKSIFIQGVAILLSVLIALPLCIPIASAITYGSVSNAEDDLTDISVSLHDSDTRIPHSRPHDTLSLFLSDPQNILDDVQQGDDPVTEEFPSNTETSEPEEEFLQDSHTPLTQEAIARQVEASMNKQARGGSRIYYPWPSGAMAVDLYKDGKQILKGQVADIGGTVYVPVQRFADLFGNFKTVYTQATEQVVITGTNLSITVKVGDPYITVNERIFYTGAKVISLGGWIFVPLTSMCKALNATVTIRSNYYDATITSGDPTKVKWASEYYDSTDLYWLSRIISAEAKGEPFAGQIAVGNVVLNRVRSSQFPNTVKGVIFDTKYGTQFSPVASGTIYQTPTGSSIMAAKICLEGYSLSSGMIYFYNPSIATSNWIGRTRPYIMTIGNHKFYG